MQTQCKPRQFEFKGIGGRAVAAGFDGGAVSSDAGALPLSKTADAIGLIERFAGCLEDHRDADLIEHSVKMLVGQRVLGVALGYEDLIDHDRSCGTIGCLGRCWASSSRHGARDARRLRARAR